MEQYYTDEKNVQIVIALLKAHGIKRVVASPGSTNVTFVGSIQQDSWFEIYSCVDERSAAYMACGIAAETNEPVVLSCTGATASRNYFSALTEAYYRKLSILAITSTQDESKIGNLRPQVIDRSYQPKDTVKCSLHLQNIKDKTDELDCILKTNIALLELNHHGKGPVHINLSTTYSKNFSVKILPKFRKIDRYQIGDALPQIERSRVAIFIGSHLPFNSEETEKIDLFCSKYNGVVFCDPGANYFGKFRINFMLAQGQNSNSNCVCPDLLIHIGEMSDFAGIVSSPKEVWRVSEDGKLSDRYGRLTNVFEMTEYIFFSKYIEKASIDTIREDYLKECKSCVAKAQTNVPDFPFSHLWVAQHLYKELPKNCCLHLGILSPLRSWSFWEIDPSISIFCNQGGFGIDGNMSTLLGASIINPKKLYFGVFGDLSFFYDLNSLGNRHKRNNLRILLINNSLGAEFHLSKQQNSIYVDGIDKYISAGGHFGHQSPDVVRHLSQDWGFEYLSASNKDEFLSVYKRFVAKELSDKPMVFEVFTDVENEDKALVSLFCENKQNKVVSEIKNQIKDVLGKKRIDAIKTIITG